MNDASELLTINIRGTRFEVSREQLKLIGSAKLCALNRDSASYRAERNEHYFDANPCFFHCLLDSCHKPCNLHLPTAMCIEHAKQQMSFWSLSDASLAPCCYDRYERSLEREITMKEVAQKTLYLGRSDASFDKPGLRAKLYRFLEDPNSSRMAKAWSVFIMALVVLSVVNLMVTSVWSTRDWISDDFRERYERREERDEKRQLVFFLKHSRPKVTFWILEVFSVVVLSAELIARFVVSPNRCQFFTWRHIPNIIDLMGILPMWAVLAVELVRVMGDDLEHNSDLLLVVYILMHTVMLRVFRLLRIMDFFRPLRLMQLSLLRSKDSLILIFIFVTVSSLCFANVMFIAEIREDNFASAFECWWWAIITLTTIGYGDTRPHGVYGYVVGGVCAMTSIVVIALPVPIIVGNFNMFYDCARTVDRLKERARRHMCARSSCEISATANDSAALNSISPFDVSTENESIALNNITPGDVNGRKDVASNNITPGDVNSHNDVLLKNIAAPHNS